MRNVFILGAVLGVFAFAHAEDKVSGDFLLDGWAFAGDSLDTDPIFWSRGNTVGGFSAYYTSFTLSNAHTVSGSTGLFGNATGSLVNGSTWQAGDLIFGMGVDSLDDNIYENGFYYKFDFTNTSNWTPASSIGALDGLSSFTTGGNEPQRNHHSTVDRHGRDIQFDFRPVPLRDVVASTKLDTFVCPFGGNPMMYRVVLNVRADRFKNATNRHHHSPGNGLRLRSLEVHRFSIHLNHRRRPQGKGRGANANQSKQ